MSDFLKTIAAITKPQIKDVEFDFGGEVGKQTIRVRCLDYKKRQDIFVKRLKDGKLDVSGEALHMNAELIAATLVDENGKAVATTEAISQWDSVLVDKLSDFIGRTIGVLDEKKDDEENPSIPQS
jgi:hypothetical protein